MLKAHPMIVEFLRKNRYRRTPMGMMPNLGDGVCRWCGGEVKRPRRSWCSDECVNEFRVIFWPGYATEKVHERDNGICSVCGIDTEELWELRIRCFRLESIGNYQETVKQRRENWGPWRRNATRLWEMDHVVPVIEGGGSCGLENLRTLCCACHDKETKQLAGRRSERNTKQMKLKL